MDFIKSKHKAEQELRDNDIEFDYSTSAGLNFKLKHSGFNYAYMNKKLNHCTLYVRHYKTDIDRIFKCELGRFYKLI
jgi:hypothetical protein